MSDTFVQTVKILEVSTGETPPSGYVGLYAKDGNLYQINSSGVSKNLNDAGGGSSASFKSTIGNGVAVVYNVVHSLGITDVQVQITRLSDGAQSFPRVKIIDLNTVRVTFAQPIATSSYRILITQVGV